MISIIFLHNYSLTDIFSRFSYYFELERELIIAIILIILYEINFKTTPKLVYKEMCYFGANGASSKIILDFKKSTPYRQICMQIKII